MILYHCYTHIAVSEIRSSVSHETSKGLSPKQTQGKPLSACSDTPTNVKGWEPLGHLVLRTRTGRFKYFFFCPRGTLPTFFSGSWIQSTNGQKLGTYGLRLTYSYHANAGLGLLTVSRHVVLKPNFKLFCCLLMPVATVTSMMHSDIRLYKWLLP